MYQAEKSLSIATSPSTGHADWSNSVVLFPPRLIRYLQVDHVVLCSKFFISTESIAILWKLATSNIQLMRMYNSWVTLQSQLFTIACYFLEGDFNF